MILSNFKRLTSNVTSCERKSIFGLTSTDLYAMYARRSCAFILAPDNGTRAKTLRPLDHKKLPLLMKRRTKIRQPNSRRISIFPVKGSLVLARGRPLWHFEEMALALHHWGKISALVQFDLISAFCDGEKHVGAGTRPSHPSSRNDQFSALDIRGAI
jgi:hypothetical protein